MNIGFNRVKIIKKQLNFIDRDTLENITVDSELFKISYPENISGDIKLYFTITGTDGTPWEGLVFKGILTYGMNYPTSAPTLRFITKLYHPNVFPSGELCISILHDGIDQYGSEDISLRWSPAHTINTILKSTQTLFNDPNCDSPANCSAKINYQNNIETMKHNVNKYYNKEIASRHKM